MFLARGSWFPNMDLRLQSMNHLKRLVGSASSLYWTHWLLCTNFVIGIVPASSCNCLWRCLNMLDYITLQYAIHLRIARIDSLLYIVTPKKQELYLASLWSSFRLALEELNNWILGWTFWIPDEDDSLVRWWNLGELLEPGWMVHEHKVYRDDGSFSAWLHILCLKESHRWRLILRFNVDVLKDESCTGFPRDNFHGWVGVFENRLQSTIMWNVAQCVPIRP